jgi:hypothetical protein
MGRINHFPLAQSVPRLGLGVRPDILTFATNASKSIAKGKYQNIRPDTNGKFDSNTFLVLKGRS